MYKKVFSKKAKYKAVSVLLASMMLLAGCGKDNDYSISDYQNGEENTAAGTSDEGLTGEDDSEANVEAVPVQTGSAAEKLGSMPLKYENDFMIGGNAANINVETNVWPGDEEGKLPSYKVKGIREEDVNEEEIVKNLFGESGKKIEGSLNTEMGDSVHLISSYFNLLYAYTGKYPDETSECKAQVDEEDYYIHAYEGMYNNIEYQLLISYNRIKRCESIALFPRNLAELSGNSELNRMGYYFPISGFWGFGMSEEEVEKAEASDVDKLLSEKTNKCTLSDEALKDNVYKMFQDNLGISFIDSTITFNDSSLSVMGGAVYYTSSGSDPSSSATIMEYNENGEMVEFSMPDDIRVELVYCPEKVDDLNSEAVKSGYLADLNSGYFGMSIGSPYTDKNTFRSIAVNAPYMYRFLEAHPDKIDMINSGNIWVDDSGVIGFDVTICYNAVEKLADDVSLLSFENAMQSFEEQVSQNMDVTQLGFTRNDTKGKIYFKQVDLISYMLPSPDNNNEYTFIPVWAISSMNSTSVQSITLINAMDGSLVDILY